MQLWSEPPVDGGAASSPSPGAPRRGTGRHRAGPRRSRPRPAQRSAPDGGPRPGAGADTLTDEPPREDTAGAGAAPAPAPARSRGHRLLVLTGFWVMLTVSVALWWFNTPAGQLTGPGAVLTAIGRATGLAGGFVLLVQVLLTSRVGLLEKWAGAHDLMTWHRRLGASTLLTILAHAVFTTYGYAVSAQTSVTAQAWTLLTTAPDVAGAFTATGILVGVATLAIRSIRRRMRYELWHLLHLAAYLVLLLAYGHQFGLGSDLRSPVARGYWMGLYALVIGTVFWGRVIEPVRLNWRHRLRVSAVVPESPDAFSVYLHGRQLQRLEARAGQFFRWRFLTGDGWWQSHPFSLSSAPNEKWLRLTINAVGDHTTRLRSLRPDTRVIAEGPFGTFTADRRLRRQALLIAGGSGIAPVRALLEQMPPRTAVIYRARSEEDLVFRAELDYFARHRGIEIHYVLGSRDEPGPQRLFSSAGLAQLVPDVARRDVYLCGSPGLVAAVMSALRQLRVPRRQIHLDPFEF